MIFRTLGTLLIFFTSSAAFATPSLQLDIFSDGTFYDNSGVSSLSSPDGFSTLTTSDEFTLYAYGNTANGNGSAADFSVEHYISVAIVPQGTTAGTDFGSFSFAGTTYTTSNMDFGFPPYEANIGHDGGDLSGHGVYETLFTEVAFNFDSNVTRVDVNTEDNSGTNPLTNSGNAMAYVGFDVDTSDLLEGFELHFDLYNVRVKNNGDIDRDDFAPFSHDAGTTSVPAPATFALLGLGLIGLAVTRRKNS